MSFCKSPKENQYHPPMNLSFTVQQATPSREVFTQQWLRKEGQLSLLRGVGVLSPTHPANYLADSFNLNNQFPPWQVRYTYFILR